MKFLWVVALLLAPNLVSAQSSIDEQSVIDLWVNSVSGDGYHQSHNVDIANKSNTYDLVCRGHEATDIVADQPAVECAVFTSSHSDRTMGANQTSLLAKLQFPFIHEVTEIKVHGKHGFTIEGSSHRCAYTLIYYWFDLVISDSAEQQEWPYTVREDDCWR